MKDMKVSGIQLDVMYNQPKENFEKVHSSINQLMEKEKPDVILLPEMWNVSFFPDELEGVADYEGTETRALLSRLAKEHAVNIVGGSVATKYDGHFYNTSYIYNREGQLVHTYHKVHLFSPADEHEKFKRGDHLGLVELDGVKVGIATCYDLRFVEWIRLMALKGMEVLFVPAAWPHPRLQVWQTLLKARAIENQIYVVGVNTCGATDDLKFCGHSAVISPLGKVITELNESEETFTENLDLSKLKGIRKDIGVFKDRRPELYH